MKALSLSHLNAVFGLPEICAELIALIDMPVFEKAWLQYCELYNATPEEQKAVLGKDLGKLNLRQAHARLTAFAARKKNDPVLAAHAWKEFKGGDAGIRHSSQKEDHIEGSSVSHPVDEAAGISTNSIAQWSLTAMAILDYLGLENNTDHSF